MTKDQRNKLEKYEQIVTDMLKDKETSKWIKIALNGKKTDDAVKKFIEILGPSLDALTKQMTKLQKDIAKSNIFA